MFIQKWYKTFRKTLFKQLVAFGVDITEEDIGEVVVMCDDMRESL